MGPGLDEPIRNLWDLPPLPRPTTRTPAQTFCFQPPVYLLQLFIYCDLGGTFQNANLRMLLRGFKSFRGPLSSSA